MRHTKEDTAKTRQKLIDAGLKVFSRKGYSATRLDDIAKETKLTRGAIYWHFGNKLELYRILMEESFITIQKIVAEVLSTELSPLQKIRSMVINMCVKLEEDRMFCAIVELGLFKSESTEELAPLEKEYKKVVNQIIELLITLAKTGQSKNEIKLNIDPKDLAWAVISYINGIMSTWLADQKRFSLSEKVEIFVDLFFDGLTKK